MNRGILGIASVCYISSGMTNSNKFALFAPAGDLVPLGLSLVGCAILPNVKHGEYRYVARLRLLADCVSDVRSVHHVLLKFVRDLANPVKSAFETYAHACVVVTARDPCSGQ